ncbi:putative transferase [Actinoplanes missouriensis 431]|uniref:Putative transferase n=1 Tax=Actinoplanes missouriensis (strain ATCC 14538 / DSM 43046 / CBS 188.64 / JCM 3121 / NBRC 102363 / NCIMB 12654 / NRRL B-3342 / UNCC 431) TaxID=512565 RepID=I0H9T3_ACTM4|nr:UbiA family prenyltransferase [Actinoplanes missouriensis]BAL89770.1 putative transferase [Actinoplanes missouriensis 431]
MPDRPRWRDLAELVRAPAALSVPGDAIAGAAAAGGLNRRTAGLAAASISLYWAGMAANDWADRDLDAVERPERPVPSGRITPGQALAVASGLTAAGVGIAALTGGRRSAAVAVPLAGAIWLYDLWAKNTAAGPPMMALCRGLDVLLGASGGQGRGAGWVRDAAPAAVTMAAHTATVTLLSRREVTGGGANLPSATLAATVALAAACAKPSGGTAGRTATALAGWYATWYGTAQVRAATEPSANRFRAAVGAGITGMPPLQGALTARAGAPVTGLAVAAAAPLAKRLTKRLSAT